MRVVARRAQRRDCDRGGQAEGVGRDIYLLMMIMIILMIIMMIMMMIVTIIVIIFDHYRLGV